MITFDNFSFRYEERDKFTSEPDNTDRRICFIDRSERVRENYPDLLPEWVDSTFLPRRVKGGYSVGRTLFAGIEAV